MEKQEEKKVETVKPEEKATISTTPCGMILHSIGFALLVIGVNLLIMKERILAMSAAETESYVNSAYILPDDKKVRNQYDRDIVMLYSVNPHPSFALHEDDFDIGFGKQMRVRRITEYCQWKEFKKADGSVSYEKGWYDHNIISDDFVDEEHHLNINRDPFPSRVEMPRRIVLGSFVVDPQYFDNYHPEPHRYESDSFPTDFIPATTRKEGFNYVSQYWYYSKVNLLDDTTQYGHKNFTHLNPEEEEEFAMNCQPGDIRVGFETERFPVEVTVVGIQNDYRIMPIREDGKVHYILFDKHLNSKEVLNYYEDKLDLNLTYWRILCGIIIFFGILLRYEDQIPFPNLPLVLRALACSIVYPLSTSLATRAYLYGLTDNNVFRMGLYTVLPFLLFFSLDVLFKLIKMYNYGLKIIELQKQEKKEKED